MHQKQILTLLTLSSLGFAQSVSLDAISVTATKIETGTKEVSQSISVVNSQTIEDKNIFNISDALVGIPGVQAESSSNSPSPKIIIRGAGLKARYGVREIMVIKDGMPMTDPDSFTRFDYIDMQDVESIEVQKGPGSINAVNATGGVIQLITKSVFAEDQNSIKVGMGNDGQKNLNIKLRSALSEKDFASMSFTHRNIENDWRDNNEFDSTQLSIKYGHIFDDDATLESEISYTKSNSELPASMNTSEFQTFLETGEQHNTSSPWQNSARDSEIWSINAKYEKELGENFLFKPRFYFNHWKHFHPVTALINDSDDNNVFGTDLETNYTHTLFDRDANLVFGFTAKQDRTNDAKKYTYKDYTDEAGPSAAIATTLSNEVGDLAKTEDSTSTLYGVYFQEQIKPLKDLSVDISLRIDKINFDVSGYEYLQYNWSGFSNPSTYYAGDGSYGIDTSYTLLSPKLGFTYALSDLSNIYFSIAQANQAPTGSEISANESLGSVSLDKTTSTNYEIGLKTRSENYSYDLAIYQNDVKDEITAVKTGWTTHYENAGKTQKRGLEFIGNYKINSAITIGASYAYSDFKFKTFLEEGTEDRSGNYLPYIPKHQYSFNISYQHPSGFKSRLQTKSYGSYYMDNANTQKYEGYSFVTDIMIGYEKKAHLIQLNIANLFDKYYAMDASRDIDGDDTYKAAAPRSVMLTYNYKF